MSNIREILIRVTIISLTTIINRCLVDAGCSGSVLICYEPSEEMDEIEFDQYDLDGHRIDIDARLLGVAVPLIEEQLTRRDKKDDMYTNLKEIERMIKVEIDAKYLSNDYAHRKPRLRAKSNCLSSRLDLQQQVYSKSDIMINALSKLHDLKRIDEDNLGCTSAITHDLTEVNLMAGDPIGRRSRNETALFPRVDNMIIEAALRRAMHCFVHYRNALRELPSFDGYKSMKAYWNRVFEHRMKKEHPEETRRTETLFFENPRKCFEFVQKMPHAIEEGEEYIAQDLFTKKTNNDDENGELKRYKRGLDAMVKLCTTFSFLVADVLESLEFDMQLDYLIPSRLLDMVENDYMLNKQRSYQIMCQKLIHDPATRD